MMLQDGDKQGWSESILDAAIEVGITTFDHGWVYGGGACERVFGAWMKKRGNREKLVILDKGCHHNRDRKRVTPYDIQADIADSLARLGTAYIDIWMFHRDDPAVPVGPLVEALNQAISDGKIRCYGGSNWSRARMEEANEYARKHGLVPFAASSPNFSLADQIDSPWGTDCLTISGPAHASDREWYAKNRMPVFTWSSLARGFFSGRMTRKNFEEVKAQFEEHTIRCYVCEDNWKRLDRAEELAARYKTTVPQIALAFVLRQDFDSYALVGGWTPEEIRANVSALDLPLTPSDIAYLDLKK
jgi:aryl-alcohol dehydrogenase-like predicted oxidoreductase